MVLLACVLTATYLTPLAMCTDLLWTASKRWCTGKEVLCQVLLRAAVRSFSWTHKSTPCDRVLLFTCALLCKIVRCFFGSCAALQDHVPLVGLCASRKRAKP